jgi:hypothetical protein
MPIIDAAHNERQVPCYTICLRFSDGCYSSLDALGSTQHEGSTEDTSEKLFGCLPINTYNGSHD